MKVTPHIQPETAYRSGNTVVMPAGTYRLGDPCYHVPSDLWMPWLEAADFTKESVLLANIDGKPVLGFSTAWGDGLYPGSDGRGYPVDAGLIGLVPLDLSKSKDDGFLGSTVTFEESFTCTREGGTLTFGHIVIETDDEADEDEDDDL